MENPDGETLPAVGQFVRSFSIILSNFIKYYQIFSNIFNFISNIFQYFLTFSNTNNRFDCQSEGGVPSPKLRFLVGGETVEATSEEEISESEQGAVLSLQLEEEHFNQPVLCTAHNRASTSPISSNTININFKRRFSY